MSTTKTTHKRGFSYLPVKVKGSVQMSLSCACVSNRTHTHTVWNGRLISNIYNTIYITTGRGILNRRRWKPKQGFFLVVFWECFGVNTTGFGGCPRTYCLKCWLRWGKKLTGALLYVIAKASTNPRLPNLPLCCSKTNFQRGVWCQCTIVSVD